MAESRSLRLPAGLHSPRSRVTGVLTSRARTLHGLFLEYFFSFNNRFAWDRGSLGLFVVWLLPGIVVPWGSLGLACADTFGHVW